MASIFGFQITRLKPTEKIPSIAPVVKDDGAIVISSPGPMAAGLFLDLEGTVKNESELVTKYRDMAGHPEIDNAIDEIVNEAIVSEEGEKTVEIVLDDCPIPPQVKSIITEEFEQACRLLEFNTMSYEVFRKWYIDGRIYYLVLVDPQNPMAGIQELRYLDPRKIRKIRQVRTSKDKKSATTLTKTEAEFYVYSDKALLSGPMTQQLQNFSLSSNGVKISKDSVIHVTSGLTNTQNTLVLSYLHKAIKPLNQLRSMEDSLIIYRISRAPERRIFYIDVGNLPHAKAEQYVKDIMTKHKNKIVYNAETGELRDDRKFMTMLEDYYIPRREGGKGTQIDTLPAGCLAMDTLVPLLDGRTLTIEDIASEFNSGKTLWAYSCDPETGAFAPGLITWAGVTQKSAKVMKLTLDNGESITCTPDHKFPVWGKGFVEAKDLSINESMIPFNKNLNGKNGYEQLYQNDVKEWKLTHKAVIEWKETHNLREEFIYKKEGVFDVRHHKNHNKFNNNPDNLVWMNWHDHKKYHQDNMPVDFAIKGSLAAKQKLLNDPIALAKHKENSRKTSILYWKNISKDEKKKHSKKTSDGIRNYFENLSSEERIIRNKINTNNLRNTAAVRKELMKNPDYVAKISVSMIKSWDNKERREAASDRAKLNNVIQWVNPERRILHKQKQKIVFDNKILCKVVDICSGKTTHEMTSKNISDILNNDSSLVEHFINLNKEKNTPNVKISELKFTPSILRKMVSSFGYSTWKKFRKEKELHNHRIVSIEYLSENIEVGTLTIDGQEVYHNHHTFALACGIYTKNSNLGQIEDVKYFQNRLYQSLNVPVSRLNPEYLYDVGRSTQITRDEVKFAKFIDRLRLRFSSLFLSILEKNLIIKGVVTPEEWDMIQYNIKFRFHRDNYYAELKEGEIMTNRLTLAEMMMPFVGRYFSNHEMRTKIFHQDDDDIERNDEEIAEEVNNPQFFPPEMDEDMNSPK